MDLSGKIRAMSRVAVTAALAALVVVCAVALASCGGTGQPLGPGMMSGSGGTGYHYSHLTCSAPSSVPGRTVIVVLTDMGMSQMMSGTASLGAHT